MAESDEHKYLTTSVLSAMQRMAGLGLYSYRESSRRRYDFGCELRRDWSHAVAGQTLWKHVEGVDKDVRTLIADEDAQVVLYVARDTVKARGIFHEAVTDFRRLGLGDRLHRLKVIWVPPGFDASKEEDRSIVDREILERTTTDILLNVVLGNLRDEHISHFLRGTGRYALDYAILDATIDGEMVSVPAFARWLNVGRTALPARIDRLVGCGFLSEPTAHSGYELTQRGAVFLELTGLVLREQPNFSPELLQILSILDLDPLVGEDGPFAREDNWNTHRLTSLIRRASAAIDEWDVTFERRWSDGV